MATDGFQHLAKSSPSVLFELMSKLAGRWILEVQTDGIYVSFSVDQECQLQVSRKD
jgi:hypothetical protein